MKPHHSTLALLSLLLACSSPNSGQLIVGDDDDAVGDDDDAVGDDDDAVGDDDDAAGSYWEGDWFGGFQITGEGGKGGGFEVCEGESFFAVDAKGGLEGWSGCFIETPQGGTELEFAHEGLLTEGGDMLEGLALFNRGDQVFDFEVFGGVYTEEGDELLYGYWEMTLGGGGGGGFPVVAEYYAWRDLDGGGTEPGAP